jgi:sugar lactone lactonase YvrE
MERGLTARASWCEGSSMTYNLDFPRRLAGSALGSRAAFGATALLAALVSFAGCEDDGPEGELVFRPCPTDPCVVMSPGGSGGMGGGGGMSGSGGASAPSGTLQVLTTSSALRGPTTGGVRGSDLWVVNGQLGALFGGAAPTLPFNLVSVPLAGGDVGGTVIELPGDGFYPEGTAAAPDGTLYVGSLPLGTVVRVAADSTVAMPFVAAGVAERGVVGMSVDAPRSLLWFCDSNPQAAMPGGAVVGVSLTDGSEVVRHAMPNRGSSDAPVDAGTPPPDAGDAGVPAGPPTFCNDLIVDSTGNILASDSSGRVFRVPAANVMTANSAGVWLEVPEIRPAMPGGFGANGLDIVGSSLIIANIDSGGLVAVDATSDNPASTVRTINLTLDGAAATLCGPDGVEAVPGSSTDVIVIENGSCMNPPGGDGDRVVKVTLSL